ncbi:hypothetical protein B9Z55_005291 [Caenorhabditis nigoni]|uniref:Ig-like domain-containing protein n=1 Tax=Caenorhabditis nigoni TaxID=1611254 RepID=A0A2G5V092_9PELO|nr:hypothetical protein B9Z55_005291 [Caenorhabditis nigoni]
MKTQLCVSLLLTLSLLSTSAKKAKTKSCKRTAFSRHTTNYQAWREQMTVCDLLQDYDAAVRPSGRTPYNDTRGAVIVTTSLNIRSISAVSEKNMEFVAQFRFRQEWYDDRLRFIEHQGLLSSDYRNFEFIHVARDQSLWIPDTFFQNEKNGWYHMLNQENRFLKIRSDGKLIYDRRLTLHLACSMHLSRYPMDHQNCEIAFASYSPDAYTTADIEYIWDVPAIQIHEGANGALPNFEIASFKNGSCTSKTNTGTYSCLKVEIRLNRVFSFFLLQLYIPSSMLVGVAWVSYWIDWKSTAARVPLAIVTLLTMITTSHAINSNLPPVSYAKSIDIWVGACVVFIFFSLIEYAVVNYMGILDEHRQMKKAACNRSRLSNVIDNDNFGESLQSLTFSPQEKKRLIRRRPKKNMEMQEGDFEAIEMVDRGPPRSAGLMEEGWTFHDTTDLVYIGQRKRVELVRWCSVLSSRGRAERIDIIARIIFPIAFILFNFAYWSIYLEEEDLDES